MSQFVFIIVNVILPIFFQILTGFLLQKKFHLNTSTLAKLQFFILTPALLFTQIYKASISARNFITIMAIGILLFLILYIISIVISRVAKYSKSNESTFVNGVCFYNSGNYSIPLIQLLYKIKDSLVANAMSVQVVVMLTQLVLINTVGIFNVNTGHKSIKDSILETLKIPMIYAVIIAIIFRSLHVPVWAPIYSSLEILGQGLIPVALITLGAQLATTQITIKIPKVYVVNFLRLIISPAIAFLLVRLFSIEGLTGQVIVICAAAPTAVNTVLLAIEYKNDPELASQVVFSSTLLSALTVTLVIAFVQIYLPII